MAKQIGVYRALGTIDGITMYRTAESGLLVRKKSSLDKERFLKDPAFEPTRKESSEFGRGSVAANLLRSTMKTAGFELSDTRIYSRLTGVLRRALSTDTMHPKGERTLEHADLNRLKNFEWNKQKAFGRLYYGQPKFSIDTGSGLMEIDLPGIDSPNEFNAHPDAQYVQFVLEGGTFDFESGKGTAVSDSTEWLNLKRKHPSQALHGTVALQPGMRLLLGIGIRFGQEVNDGVYELRNQQFKGFMLGAVV